MVLPYSCFVPSVGADLIFKMVAQPTLRAVADKTAFCVLQDLVLKLKQSCYVDHPDFWIGFRAGVTHYTHTTALQEFVTPLDVVQVARENLSPCDHDDLNAFCALMSWPTVDYSYRVGFVYGWIMFMIFVDEVPAYPVLVSLPFKRVRRRSGQRG